MGNAPIYLLNIDLNELKFDKNILNIYSWNYISFYLYIRSIYMYYILLCGNKSLWDGQKSLLGMFVQIILLLNPQDHGL